MKNISKDDITTLYASGKFDASWYQAQYPDVGLMGLDPAEHYLWIGRRLGRLSSPPAPEEMCIGDAANPLASHEAREESGFRSIRTFMDAERTSFLKRLRFVTPSRDFGYRPLISILMPAYKSPIPFLEKAVNSIVKQSYHNWEIIIVDDGSNDAELTSYLIGIAKQDDRIVVKHNKLNSGISGATNDALTLAQGEFIALFDHDDIMTLDALERNVAVLNFDPGLDLIYSDECRVDESDIPIDMFRKPNWSSFMLLNSMYTGHLSVYRRSLVERVGGFRSCYDFSQDYDLALRVTEHTARVYHIPELLYGWRAIAGSGAAGGKDFARESNIAALQDAMDRRHITGKAIPLPTANRTDRRGFMPTPLVSIIIPSDNGEHITAAVRSIIEFTEYPNYEIVIVTNSGLINALSGLATESVRFAAFDDPFNFSAKCNVGANSSLGDYYCFFNDDVRPISRDWIDALLEYGLMSDVGAVGAKLLYENGTIQHAGMVTGVRNLIGTAFHCLPSDSSAHFNMAQFVRDVTLLCGALILMSRGAFHAVGGWNEDEFAIAHSDTDLCLKVWEAGLRCVYTPYATLTHIGHVSIAQEELSNKKKKIQRKEKGEISLLRRWPQQIAEDPHWPYAIVRSAYHDSQEYFRIHAGRQFPLGVGRDVLIVIHELTQSGAPVVALEMARALLRNGDFVVVIAPEDGPMRDLFNENGITVIIDELLFSEHQSVKTFCESFDVVISNTIVTWPLVKHIMADVKVKWYIHESDFLNNYITENNLLFDDFGDMVEVWAVTSIPANILSRYGWKTKLLPPGVRTTDKFVQIEPSNDLIEVLVLGGYEPRKGQDLAIEMLAILPLAVRESIRLKFHGRLVDSSFHRDLVGRADSFPSAVLLSTSLSREDAQEAISRSDIVLVPSRDESFSLVVAEALLQSSIVVCSKSVGAAEFLEHGVHAFIAETPAPNDLASAFQDALTKKEYWPSIKAAGKSLATSNFTDRAFEKRFLEAIEDI